MCASFSDDDVGKTVVNASGEEVGLVSAVEHDTLRVKPDPGITDSIKAALGWEGTSENTYPLQEESIDRITDDEIRLTGGFQEGERSAAGGTSPSGRDTTGEAGVGTESGRTGGESGIDTDHDDSGLMDTDIGDDDDELIDTDIGDDDDELIDTDIGDDESGLMDSDRSEPRHEEGLSGGPGDGRTDESSGSEIGTGSETGARGDVGSDMGSGGREGGMSDVGDRSDRSRADRDSGMGDADDDELIDTDIGDDDDDLLDSDDDDDELIDTDIGDDDDDLLDSDDDRRTRDSDR